jgi:NAD dependent epimerase/dehydratase family enzyme
MHIVIAGGSGFLGRGLSSALVEAGHRVQILTRRPTPPRAGHPTTPADGHTLEPIVWTPDGSLGPWASACAGADTVINLAGESIGTARWSSARKAQLAESRILATRSLVRFMTANLNTRASGPEHTAHAGLDTTSGETGQRLTTLVSASAIGYYGDRGDDTLTEDARAGSDFLATLAAAWEDEALLARSGTTRVVLLRTGIVLDPTGGALAKMLTPFKLFAGGPFGSGRQYMSWIHRDDWVSLVRWALDTPDVRGPINLTAPHPVTNAEFARALGHALHRPALFPTPAFALKFALGEMADPLLLFSQRVIPARALAGGFRFAFETIEAALRALLVS